MLSILALVMIIILPIIVAIVATVLLRGLPGPIDDAYTNQVFPWASVTNGCIGSMLSDNRPSPFSGRERCLVSGKPHYPTSDTAGGSFPPD